MKSPLDAGIRMHLSVCFGKPGASRPIGRPRYNARMLSLVISTIAFFVAAYLIKRYLDEIGVPKTAGRGLVVFVLALAVAYGVSFSVDWAAGLAG